MVVTFPKVRTALFGWISGYEAFTSLCSLCFFLMPTVACEISERLSVVRHHVIHLWMLYCRQRILLDGMGVVCEACCRHGVIDADKMRISNPHLEAFALLNERGFARLFLQRTDNEVFDNAWFCVDHYVPDAFQFSTFCELVHVCLLWHNSKLWDRTINFSVNTIGKYSNILL